MAYFRGLGDEAAQCEFHNSKLGNPFIPDGGQVTDVELENCFANYSKRDNTIRPKVGGGRLITMGVDQGKLNHVVIAEFFATEYGYDINAISTEKVLWEGHVPGDDFRELDRLMREWQVLGCVIDADPQINDARRFARRFHGYVHLCRYRRGQSGKEMSITEEEGGAPIATVDRTNWLDATLGRFYNGRIQLPADTSLEFRDHLKNLVRTYERDENNNPKATYMTTGPDHMAHALNYAEIALPLAASIVTGRDIGRFL